MSSIVDCITNYCFLRSVEFPTFDITTLQGRYAVRIFVLLLFCPTIVMNVLRPKPDLSFHFYNTANNIYSLRYTV